MIVIKVELHSAATGNVTELGSAKIINLGTGTKTRSNYLAEFRGKKGHVMFTTTLNDWPRMYRHFWDLLATLLKERL